VRLYNTLTRAVEELVPSNADGKLRLYECGPTPSGEPHIGHARPAITVDILKRWLAFRGTPVVHVRNVTDVEDKLIDKANELRSACRRWWPATSPCSRSSTAG
jgi:cysteinyl-tRNA synthetase